MCIRDSLLIGQQEGHLTFKKLVPFIPKNGPCGPQKPCIRQRVHIVANWQIRLNGPCTTAMRPRVGLRWPLVVVSRCARTWCLFTVCSAARSRRGDSRTDLPNDCLRPPPPLPWQPLPRQPLLLLRVTTVQMTASAQRAGQRLHTTLCVCV